MAVLTPNTPSTDYSRTARILYDNLLTSASVTDAAKTLIPNTWERWRSASGTMQSTFQLTSAQTVSVVGIAGHNLASTGSTIVIATAPTIAGTFTDRASLTPTDNDPLWFEFDPVSVQDVRVTITGGTDREVAVIYAGDPLRMTQPIYGGHNPIDLQAETSFRNNNSESGQFLGRDIIRRGLQTSYAWRHLDDQWIRDTFKPFIISARKKPFFIKWRPDYYDAVAFGYAIDDIKPSNMGGGHRLMSVNFTMRAHDDL